MTILQKTPNSKFHILLWTILVLIILFPYNASCMDETDFFTYKRFFPNQKLLDTIPKDGKLKTDLVNFSKEFSRGLEAMSSDKLDWAKQDFLKAREIWPEYFGTDFLLALVYEDQEDYKTAARYYRSYLDKLKRYHEGMYRISGSIIKGITPYNIEPYNVAYGFIQQHLAVYEINIDNVRAAYTVPEFIAPFFIAIILVFGYIFVRFKLRPYLRNQYRLKHPPDGFWVCKYCYTATPNLSMVCNECGRERSGSGEK